MQTHTIHLDAVKLTLYSAKLRRRTNGGTALMCALSGAPLIMVDCNTDRRTFSQMRDLSINSRRIDNICGLMKRGHIGKLIQRTRDLHGLKEVKKAFGFGLLSLKAENLYILNGGAA